MPNSALTSENPVFLSKRTEGKLSASMENPFVAIAYDQDCKISLFRKNNRVLLVEIQNGMLQPAADSQNVLSVQERYQTRKGLPEDRSAIGQHRDFSSKGVTLYNSCQGKFSILYLGSLNVIQL